MKLSFIMAVKFAILRRSALTGAISLSRCSSVRTKPEEALAVAVTSILLTLNLNSEKNVSTMTRGLMHSGLESAAAQFPDHPGVLAGNDVVSEGLDEAVLALLPQEARA